VTITPSGEGLRPALALRSPAVPKDAIRELYGLPAAGYAAGRNIL
jgi:hypothetical protein